ncbi:MAG: hypothetical protein ACFFE5_00790 [Candidatus Thorarchaeota archaeon]
MTSPFVETIADLGPPVSYNILNVYHIPWSIANIYFICVFDIFYINVVKLNKDFLLKKIKKPDLKFN